MKAVVTTIGAFLAGVLLFAHAAQSNRPPSAAAPLQSFTTPAEAVIALQRALSTRDLAALRRMFGPGLENLINPDLVEATNEFATLANAIVESNRIVATANGRAVIEFGRDNSPFAVPLWKQGGGWVFDTAAGREEVINRRIGRNELTVLEVVRTYVEAQREYAAMDRDGDAVLEYAQKFASSPGKKDGLFWPPDLDGTMSPLGPLVAEAQAAGYRRGEDSKPQAFHGYYFRILTKQDKHAPGGSYDYVINGNMIGGFALVAWPAEYDRTGVMTFIVNQQGRVYQKDLGGDTHKVASAMKSYNPNSGWYPSPD